MGPTTCITNQGLVDFDIISDQILFKFAKLSRNNSIEEDNNEIPVSIFSVPTTLLHANPNAYTPQQVALGPYHHWRQELYEMERYKIAAARRTVKHLQCFNNFQEIVDQIYVLESRIRASYHKYLNLNGETLAWMMAIDVAFLLEFLEVYARKEYGKLLTRVTSRLTSNLVDSAGRKSAHIAILRDILMLENQIPLFLLRKMFEFQLGSLDAADDMLLSMLRGLSKELYPFKTPDKLPKILIEDSAHVLDFFYRLLMPKAFRKSQITDHDEEFNGENEKYEEIIIDEESQSKVLKFFNVIWKTLSKLNIYPVRFFKALLNSKLLKVLLKMPGNIITKLPVLKMVKEPIANIFMREKEDLKPENDSFVRSPLLEELTIPSVTLLSKSGVRVVPTDGGICSTHFDDDAKFLRERGIIFNRLKSDEEVANFCNGMSRSVKLTKVPFLDKVVEDVNKYYNGRWKVKAEKCIRSYVYGSWKILTVLACIVLLCLMALHTVCSVYTCSRVIHLYADTDQP
ncbi:hypothetical protein POM88_009653 [Heracleum sosnowskyi]|uniref:Uncharacterized protein n=1 Tax=Heracleum sosnowskyi TaxID=360622 RepID=A0AAD8JC79_9APIA|nr:hypothetical protein POM88_009653 [Heracleum sosnowskyi]